MPRYYVEMDGHEYGPFDRDELAQLKDDGILSADSIVREERSSDGVPLNEMLQTVAGATAAGPQAAAPEFVPIHVDAAEPPPPPAQAPIEAPVLEASPAIISEVGTSAAAGAAAETWSERLSRLRSQAGSAQPTFSALQNDRDDFDEGGDPVPPAAGAPKSVPDFLFPGGAGAEIDEGIQYRSALREAEAGGDGEDDGGSALPGLGFKLDSPIESSFETNSPESGGLPPLGAPVSQTDIPTSWSMAMAGPAPEIGPLPGVDESAIPVGAPAPSPESEPAPAAGPGDPAAAGSPEWKQRLAQLDVIYGRPGGEGAARSAALSGDRAVSAGASFQADDPSLAAQADGPEAPARSPLLGGLALVAVGGVALMAAWNYALVPNIPFALAAAMAAYGGLSVNGGILAWVRVKWAASAMRLLLLVPLGVALASCYYFKDDIMNLVFPAVLKKPLMNDVVVMIVSAIGLATLPKRSKKGQEGT